jgi:hypothetical protein
MTAPNFVQKLLRAFGTVSLNPHGLSPCMTANATFSIALRFVYLLHKPEKRALRALWCARYTHAYVRGKVAGITVPPAPGLSCVPLNLRELYLELPFGEATSRCLNNVCQAAPATPLPSPPQSRNCQLQTASLPHSTEARSWFITDFRFVCRLNNRLASKPNPNLHGLS